MSLIIFLLYFKNILIYGLRIINIRSYSDFVSSNRDIITFIFSVIVCVIRGFAFIYSSWYVGSSKSFSILVLLFVCRMICLIIFTNLWIFIWGWDFLGVVSYLLVINYLNQRSNNAGMITILSNRVGDRFMLIRLSLLCITGNWFSVLNFNNRFSLLLLLVFLTGITKRAQLPFCAWLPAAMAAPTPVSALVHSSTLVTAGVYIIVRYNQNNPSYLILVTGILTRCIAGLNARNGFDFKKLIALSTLSQLGLMFIALGLGCYKLALYHLVCHGLVKALLFLSAGSIIHQSKSTQDLRLINGITNFLPLTSFCIIITRLTLSGLPFLTCYFSKEIIINQNFIKRIWIIFYIYLAAGLTINYRLRLMNRLNAYPSFWRKNSLTEYNFNCFYPLVGLLPFSFLWGTHKSWFLINLNILSFKFIDMFTVLLWFIIIVFMIWGFFLRKNLLWGIHNINYFITNILFLPLIRRNKVNSFVQKGYSSIKFTERSWLENIGFSNYNFFSVLNIKKRLFYLNNLTIFVFIWWVLIFYLYSLYKV